MKNIVLSLVLLMLAGASGSARALGHLEPDPTGLWFDPAQPGWGLEVAQQGDTAFAALFTYDASNKPVWYVAPNLVNVIDFNEVPALMKGTLYRTTGPAFSASSFDPRSVTTTAVGDLQIAYVAPGIGATAAFDPGSPRQLAATYSIDGIAVSKTLRAQTWSVDPDNLAGAYGGHFFVAAFPAADQPTTCPDPAQLLTLPIQPFQPYAFSIVAGAAPDHVKLLWGSGVDLGCIGDMKFERDGQLASLTGNIQCAPIGFVPNGTGVAVAVRDIVVGQTGIFGSATAQSSAPGGLACNYAGEFGGVITSVPSRSGMTPDPTGVWLDPAESGWGLILTQQGPNVFAALFAYDADGKPAWWVASNVTDSGRPVNLLVGEAFSGTLYRTSGPYFAIADTTRLAATPVGSLQVAYVGGTDHLALTYAVDGTTVQKTVQRQTWGSNLTFVAGSFTGGLFPTASACGTSGLFATNPATITVMTGTAPSSVQLKWPTGPGTGCVLEASYVQDGQLATLSGPVHCGALDNPQAAPGTLTITQATVSPIGFSGFANFNAFATLDGPACTTGGFVGGVRH